MTDANLSYDIAGPDVAMIADIGASDRFAAAVAATGGRVTGRIDWKTLAAGCDIVGHVVAADAAGVTVDRLATALPMLAAMAQAARATIVIAFDESQIDVVAGALLGTDATLLCTPDTIACSAAIALAGGAALRPALHDIVREGESARLERLNAEVARIAETLTRLTRGEDQRDTPPTPIVGDRSLAYGAPPASEENVRAADVRRTIRTRRLRDAVFGAGLFEDPAWDMLLDLFAAELERAQVSVSSLCIAAAVAPTTALRWIAKLADAGLFVREPDPFDRRRAFMTLSPKASAAMHEYWAAAMRSVGAQA